MKTALIVGAGISGATCARLLAEKGYAVTVIEKRSKTGGNCADILLPDRYVQCYGPHIFHTDSIDVVQFINRFAKWEPYKHEVLANLKCVKQIPVPFNFISLREIYGDTTAAYYELLLKRRFKRDYIYLNELTEPFNDIKKFIIKHIFAKYSKKQWGKPYFMIDKAVINRIPIKLSDDCTYFTDKYQLMPKNGFSDFIDNMLNHSNITVILNADKAPAAKYDVKILTGALDSYFKYVYGKLKYRSLDFKFAAVKTSSFQNAAVVNYTDHQKFTRITEFNKLLKPTYSSNISIICKEFPKKCTCIDEAFYPVKDNHRVKLYKKLAKNCGYYLCGRLANYKYLDMDDAIINAFNTVAKILEDNK